MKYRLLALIFTLMLLVAPNSQAVVVDDLYTVELPVPDQTTSQRLQVFKRAFSDVIVKVSGSSEVLRHPAMSRPIKSSSRYVHQFRYITHKSGDSFNGGKLFLRMDFNQDTVESLLRSNNIPVWGKERPSTLLLISYQLNKKTSIVSSDTTPKIITELEGLSQKQGLPILFPLLDLEDRMLFGVQDILQLNSDNIAQAAARYSPDARLTGQVSGQAGKGWQAKWQLQFSDRMFNWSFKAGSRQNLMSQAVAQLAQTLAREYALGSAPALNEEVLLMVDQVTQLSDHIKVHAYLQALDAVETVRPVLMGESGVTYRVKLRNSTEDFARLIALGHVLEQLELPQVNAATDDQAILMNYRFVQ